MAAEMDTNIDSDAQEFRLEKKTELRFEVLPNSKITLELKSGCAEIFGSRLVENKIITFCNCEKIAVFTWFGCTLELVGKPDFAYVAKETPIMTYAEVNGALELRRQMADLNNTEGPVVLITGRSDSGKSTLCRTLLNFAVRFDRSPVFVDLDAELSSISLPGTLSAVLVEKEVDAEKGFSFNAPSTYHFGHLRPASNILLYNTLVSRIAEKVQTRATGNRIARVTGSIINTCRWVKGETYESIKHAASAFKADFILVIDHERLYSELVRDMPKYVEVRLLEKSGGVVKKSDQDRHECHDCLIREYFYSLQTRLCHNAINIKFCDLKVYKIGAPSLPASCMPLDTVCEDNRTKLVAVNNGPNLLRRVLSVSLAKSVKDAVVTKIIGFLYVTNVDVESETITVLAPQARTFRNNILLMGDIELKSTCYVFDVINCKIVT